MRNQLDAIGHTDGNAGYQPEKLEEHLVGLYYIIGASLGTDQYGECRNQHERGDEEEWPGHRIGRRLVIDSGTGTAGKDERETEKEDGQDGKPKVEFLMKGIVIADSVMQLGEEGFARHQILGIAAIGLEDENDAKEQQHRRHKSIGLDAGADVKMPAKKILYQDKEEIDDEEDIGI